MKNRVIYWLESVRAHVGRNAQAILVGTFCDMASHDLLRKITMAVDDQLLGLFPDMIGREVGEENGRIVRRAALHFVTCGKHRFDFLFSALLFLLIDRVLFVQVRNWRISGCITQRST